MAKKPTDNHCSYLHWISELQALAQAGLAFTKDPYDKDRFERIMKISAEIAATTFDKDPEVISNLFAAEIGYPTPRFDVRAVVFNQGKILLVQEQEDELWSLPGGWADVNHSASEVAVKEVLEESGYKVKPVKLLALYDKQKKYHGHPPQWPHSYKCFFLCELLGGTPNPSIETLDVNFFSLDELPALSPQRVTRSQIERCFLQAEHLEWPTDFD